MRIGVLRHYGVKKIVFAYDSGNYSIYGDNSYLGSLNENEFVELSFIDSGKIDIRKGASSIGVYSKIFLIQETRNTSLSLQSKIPSVKLRKYKDDFRITAEKNLTIVNLVDSDNYLAGVVESEGGGKRELEYYKVQAIMSRTYAAKYSHKHAAEGFDLCDEVHCQAYHSMMRFTPNIDIAVKETTGIIMVDERGNNIDAYFHANCGGQTCLPEYVWNNAVPYLSTFKDTFCIYTRQATWTKKIPKSEWRAFLVDEYNYPVNDPYYAKQIYRFDQEDRLAFYVSPSLGIPLRDIRMKFRLKSTYFSVEEEGGYVVLSGRGFGHGVGMCQEGAMKMAAYGFNYEQITLFYFPGARFYNLNNEYFYEQNVVEIPEENEIEEY
jgi:stage II sporulation protein D